MGRFVQLTIDVLSTTKQKMTAREIWSYAKDHGLDCSFSKPTAKSPASSLNERAWNEIKTKGTQTPLRCTGYRPRKFYLKQVVQVPQPPSVTPAVQVTRPSMRVLKKAIAARIAAKGTAKPKRKRVVALVFDRDPNVVELVRLRAKGRCELCGWQGFKTDDNSRFIEVHHLQTLASDGDDTPENAAALCPNCHCLLHYGRDKEKYLEALRSSLIEKGVKVSTQPSV